jgi:hypothetical protein
VQERRQSNQLSVDMKALQDEIKALRHDVNGILSDVDYHSKRICDLENRTM